MSCFKGIVHALACSASYADGIRRTLVAGGENVGRASLVGPVAWLCMSLNACLSDAMPWLAAVRGCLLLPCVKASPGTGYHCFKQQRCLAEAFM